MFKALAQKAEAIASDPNPSATYAQRNDALPFASELNSSAEVPSNVRNTTLSPLVAPQRSLSAKGRPEHDAASRRLSASGVETEEEHAEYVYYRPIAMPFTF